MEFLWGGTSIKLGDKKEIILSNLKKNHTLKTQASMDIVGLYNIFDSNNNPIGYVQFSKNKVSAVHKGWGNYHISKGREIIRALIGAISAIPEDRRIAFVTSTRNIYRELSIDQIELAFGKHKVQISLNEHSDGSSAIQVDEYLFER